MTIGPVRHRFLAGPNATPQSRRMATVNHMEWILLTDRERGAAVAAPWHDPDFQQSHSVTASVPNALKVLHGDTSSIRSPANLRRQRSG